MNVNTINDDLTIASRAEKALLGNRYQVVRQLGQGGMGSVWLAEDMQLDGKRFAIKMLPSILVRNKRAYAQLKAEAIVSMRLTHPNIVTLRAFEENNGNPFIVMDYIDGETLDDWLGDRAQGSGVREDEIVRLLKPIAEAIDYAHGEGVIHRDIKPANVMIRKDGHPFILDFGIAREIQETMTRVTGKMSSGTLMYMSPEQLNGDSPKKEQDIYSFAAMVYECIKGEPPFSRGNIEYQIMNKEPEPLTCPSPTVSADSSTVESSVMAGLAKNPKDRPKNCISVLCASPDKPRTHRKESLPHNIVSSTENQSLSQNESRASSSGSIEQASLRGAIIAVLFFLGITACGVLIVKNFKSDSAPRPSPSDGPVLTPPAPPIEEPSELDIAKITVEATDRKKRIDGIGEEDGFSTQKEKISEILTKAIAFAKAKQWNDAAINFTNYVEKCDALIALDSQRITAKSEKELSQTAKKRAEGENASTHDPENWNEAVKNMNLADGKFGTMQFSEATDFYRKSVEHFNFCEKKAKDKNAQIKKAKDELRKKQQAEAVESSKLAQEASKKAAAAGAKKYAVKSWNRIVEDWKRAEDYFKEGRYSAAKNEYDKIVTAYQLCIEEVQEAKKKEVKDQNSNKAKALAAFREKRYDEAYKLFMKSDLKDKYVQWYLGRMHFNGCGVPKNDIEAFNWYQKAALQDHAEAQSSLAFCYSQGYGTAKDEEKAIEWYRKSADKGNITGQLNLGFMYMAGRGVERNDKVAADWFQKAARQGNPIGQERMGYMYMTGRGVPRNYAVAIRYFQLAADKYPLARYFLGLMYETGLGVARNLEEAKKNYQKAAAAGNKHASDALKRFNDSERKLKIEKKKSSDELNINSDAVRAWGGIISGLGGLF